MRRYFTVLLILAVIPNVFAIEQYSFGIVPQQAASKLVKTWLPIFQYIERESRIKLKFATAKNIPAFEKACESGQYDFAYMNPYHYVTFHETASYNAFAKARGKKIKGIVVVNKKSKMKKLSDLLGQTLVFPSPNAFAASMLPRAALKKLNIKFTPKYVSSHDSVYKNIAAGYFVAGGGVKRTFKAASPVVRKELKVLWETKGYTPHAFAVHQRVPIEAVKKIQKALVQMENNESGKLLLNKLKIKGIEAAKNSSWNDVRKLRF